MDANQLEQLKAKLSQEPRRWVVPPEHWQHKALPKGFALNEEEAATVRDLIAEAERLRALAEELADPTQEQL